MLILFILKKNEFRPFPWCNRCRLVIVYDITTTLSILIKILIVYVLESSQCQSIKLPYNYYRYSFQSSRFNVFCVKIEWHIPGILFYGRRNARIPPETKNLIKYIRPHRSQKCFAAYTLERISYDIIIIHRSHWSRLRQANSS